MLPRCLQKAAVNDFGPRLHHSLTPLDYGGLDLTYKLSTVDSIVASMWFWRRSCVTAICSPGCSQ